MTFEVKKAHDLSMALAKKLGTIELVEELQLLLDTTAYESQKFVLGEMLRHARKHRLSATGDVDKAWAHEIEFIEAMLEKLDAIFLPKLGPSALPDDLTGMVELFQTLFPDMQIITLDELLGSAEPTPETAPEAPVDRQDGFTPVVNEELRAHFKATHVHQKTLGEYMHIMDASDEATGEVRSIYCNAEGQSFDRPAKDFHDGTRFGKIS